MNENNSDYDISLKQENTDVSGDAMTEAIPAERSDKRRKRWFWPIVSAAVCVCLVFTLMFANGVGPFAGRDKAGDPATPATQMEDGDVLAVDWATAGADYEDLFGLISEQMEQTDYTVSAMGGDLAVADAAPVDSAAEPRAAQAETAAPLGAATAGSGYYGETPQFPSGGEQGGDTDSGAVAEPPHDDIGEIEPGSGTDEEQGQSADPQPPESDGSVDPGTPAIPAGPNTPTNTDVADGENENADADNPNGAQIGEGEIEDGATDDEQESYSETNEQVAGVREADVLKTDGSYIYGINSKNMWIVSADDGEMSLVSKIAQPTDAVGQVYFEMYVAGDRLIAIRHGYNEMAVLRMEDTALAGVGNVDQTCIAYPMGGYITDTSVDIFDISDRAAPVKLHTVTQSGDYNSSRMIDGYLYLITTYYGGDLAQADGDDPRTFVPLFASDGEQITPKEDDIYLPAGAQWPCYTVVSGIDAMGGGGFVSQKSVYGDAGTVYVSQSAVYLAQTSWEEERSVERGQGAGAAQKPYTAYTNWSETTLARLTVSAGRVEPGAQARVPGYVLNQFSIDEYNGVLRLVTTNDRSTWYGFSDVNRVYTDADWARLPVGETKTTNALYTLDTNLNRLGGVTDLAPDERVYSCRFMGDIAYFVTFRQTDPLFSVDVSNPSAPRVLGALKIPGFSEYLHPYADGRLFGLGRDADPETGAQQGLKLTMFDNSNPADVKELHTLIVGDDYSVAEQNHKAILVSADKALIAFPTYDKYLVYGYSDVAGFDQIAEVRFDGGDTAWAEIRGLFIGGTFYVVGPNQIGAYAIDEAFAASGNLTVDEGAGSVDRWAIGGFPVTTLPAPISIVPMEDDVVTGVLK